MLCVCVCMSGYGVNMLLYRSANTNLHVCVDETGIDMQTTMVMGEQWWS